MALGCSPYGWLRAVRLALGLAGLLAVRLVLGLVGIGWVLAVAHAKEYMPTARPTASPALEPTMDNL